MHFNINQNVYDQGLLSRYVYVIVEGDFDVYHKVRQKIKATKDPFDNRVISK